jgi:hypothetical protein
MTAKANRSGPSPTTHHPFAFDSFAFVDINIRVLHHHVSELYQQRPWQKVGDRIGIIGRRCIDNISNQTIQIAGR